MSAALIVLAGAGVGTGAVLLFLAVRPTRSGPSSSGSSGGAQAGPATAVVDPRGGNRLPRWVSGLARPRALAALAVGAGVGAVTRWPAAAVIAGVATLGAPVILKWSSSRTATDKVEAIATWTEMLRDTMAASAGLSQAILATAPVAPGPIRDQVCALAARLNAGIGAAEALRAFADELDDPTGDLVVCALALSAQSQAHRLTELLGALAGSAREEVAMRLRIETSRASVRSGVRAVSVFSVAFAALLAVLAHSYLQPFGSASGQVVLLVIGALYAAGLVWMSWMARPQRATRLLGTPGGTIGEGAAP